MISRIALLVFIWSLLFSLALTGVAQAGHGRYLTVDEFLGAAFPAAEPHVATLWVNDASRASVEELLGHRYEALRVRYWQHGDKTAWIFDEIGKEQPITVGITVTAGAVDMVRVLEFREARGWEIRHPFFTDQFSGVRMTGERKIDRTIDGITGATLSVAAVTRVVRVALFLSKQAEQPHS